MDCVKSISEPNQFNLDCAQITNQSHDYYLGSVWDAPAPKCSVFLIRAEGCNTMFHVLNGHCGNKHLDTSVLHCIRVFSFLLSNTTSRLFLPWEILASCFKNHVKTSRLFVPWENLAPSLKNHVKTSRLFRS